MAEMKLHELAKELKKTSSELIEMCAKKGITGMTQQSVVSEAMVKELRAQVEKGTPAKKEAALAKKKMHLVFHPEHSSKPLQPKKKQAPARPSAATDAVRASQKPESQQEKQPVAAEVKQQEVKAQSAQMLQEQPVQAEKSVANISVGQQTEKKQTEKKPDMIKQQEQVSQPTGKKSIETKKAEGTVVTEKKAQQTQETEEKAEVFRKKEDQEALNMQSPEKKTITDATHTSAGRQGERSQQRREDSPRKDRDGQDNQKRDRDNQNNRRDRDNQNNRRDRDGAPLRRDDGQNSQRRENQNNQGGQRRDRDGQNSGNYQRREDGQGSYQRRDRDGQGSGYQRRESSQRRDRDSQNSGNYQRREDGQGSYQRRDRDGQNSGYQRREDGQGSYQRRDRDGQGSSYQRREDGQGSYQRRDRDGQSGAYQKREDGQGFRKDQDFGTRRSNDKERSSRFGGGAMESLTPALTKNEARGGKSINKKERELREKSKQNVDKTGRFDENTKNFSKLKNPSKKPESVVEKKKEDDGIKLLVLPETMTLGELAEKMKLTAAALIKAQFMKGNLFNINTDITYEQAEEIALDFNFICEPEEKIDVIAELLKEDEESEDLMVTRPPVVCVMGHVDHGKTSLLDAIRSTNVIAREAGGITQHIGAYTVKCNGQDITFLDTPGHEAFTAMRMRGAMATDIAVLVVAADDGVMPQTIEAINHAKAAGVDIIVAINKIDKPSANVDRVMKELAEHELIPEDWGGQTIFVPVSAKTHEGIENLLEMILLDAEVKELKANPNRHARGIVIEAQLDKGRGPVATILVQKGTMHVGDTIAVGSCYGKVRAMIDDKGRRVKEATPSTPVEMLGLNDVPNAGEVLVATENEKEARSFAETFIKEHREKLLADTKTKLTLDNLNSQIKAGSLKELNIVIKADVQGSVEAVKQSLLKLSNDEVVVKVIHGAVGAINESDVTLASASGAIIIGFNVRPDTMAKALADREKVEVRLYRVIYQAISDVEAAMKGMLDPIFEEKIIGHAQVRQLFKASGVGSIAGSYVTDGVFQRGCKIRIRREGEQIYEGALASLKRFKDDVKEVKEGYECGLVFEKFNDIKEEDEVEAYIMVEVPR